MKRANILGVGVSSVNMNTALEHIQRRIQARQSSYVVAAPVHCIMECFRNEGLRKIYNSSDMVIPDGKPTAWICRLMGHTDVEQVRGPDLMISACERFLGRGYRHFFYGGWPPQVVDQLAYKLKERFPGIQIAGTYAPPFRPLTPEEDALIVKKINDAQPDILWVGLGTTKEHVWTASHVGKISAPVLIGVGAAFDFHSGRKPQAPRWMVKVGLEWFFRALTEPRRLGPRYVKDNPVFVWNILLQALGRTPPPL